MNLDRLHPRHWNPRLIWDVLMVWIALVNLGLILFDLTYLMLRPQYLRFVPVLTDVYDRVKGIEPHPLTEELRAESAGLAELLQLDPRSPGVVERTRVLERLTEGVLEVNPFERSGQGRTLEVLRAWIAQELGISALELTTESGMASAVGELWRPEPEVLAPRLERFRGRMDPLLEINYFRELTLDGRPVDHFWLLDLPFLTLFLVEFGVRWSLAVHRRRYARWFFFPIFNWYDLLGLIPLTQFRVFRLFRVASIYMRLRRSEVSRVGRDTVSRAVAWFSNIIAEEISDTVSLRILNETQDEIRDGTHTRIIDATLAARREAIERVATEQIRRIATSDPIRGEVRALLRVHLDTGLERAEALDAVPLPNAILRPLVRSVSQVVTETLLETVAATLDTEQGQQAVRSVVAAVLEQLVSGPWRRELDDLGAEIGLDVIEQMKQAVSVKKWSLPQFRRDTAEPE